MIEGKGQQILNKIQLSPTKTISTNMHNIYMFVKSDLTLYLARIVFLS